MFTFLILLAMFLALVAQHFIGGLLGLGSHVLLLPMIFLCGAAVVRLWEMLVLAFAGGLMWDCLNWIAIDGRADLPFGGTILLYAGYGALINGMRPLYLRGWWQFHVFLIGLLTSMLALIEYLVITFRREPFALVWPREVWLRILGSGLASLVLAIPCFLMLNWLGRRMGAFKEARLAN